MAQVPGARARSGLAAGRELRPGAGLRLPSAGSCGRLINERRRPCPEEESTSCRGAAVLATVAALHARWPDGSALRGGHRLYEPRYRETGPCDENWCGCPLTVWGMQQPPTDGP